MRISDWSSDVCSSDVALGDSQAVEVAVERRQPAGDLEAEGGRRRLLPAGACQHHRAALGIRQCRQPPGQYVQAVLQDVEGLAQTQDQAGVHDVLRGGAPMDVRSEEHTSELKSL